MAEGVGLSFPALRFVHDFSAALRIDFVLIHPRIILPGAAPPGLGKMAEGVGFEPTVGCPTPVFKTGAFDHSATPP